MRFTEWMVEAGVNSFEGRVVDGETAMIIAVMSNESKRECLSVSAPGWGDGTGDDDSNYRFRHVPMRHRRVEGMELESASLHIPDLLRHDERIDASSFAEACTKFFRLRRTNKFSMIDGE